MNELDQRDAYEFYEDLYSPEISQRPLGRRPLKKNQSEIVAALTDSSGLEGGFHPTYQPSRHEEGWLLSSLGGFYEQELIQDVLALVKGGKEANVYRCVAAPVTGETLCAAKVYRPRQFRNLRNDKMYQEGRVTLTEEGRAVKATDSRLMRALGKKTAFGQQVAHTSWLMYEYTTMERLFNEGASVPKPLSAGENAILMGYVGDRETSAPTLSEVSLDHEEAEPLFQEVIRNIRLMLSLDMIHGDLSAYNILYWDGTVTLIDFPQVTNRVSNSKADFILERDVTRICQYFSRQGVNCQPATVLRGLLS